MELWVVGLFASLSVGILYLLLSYIYSMFHTPKSVFQKPIGHLEIRNWRFK